MATQDQTLELPKTAKRDFLTGLEAKYQKEWQDGNVFNTDAPHDDPSLSPDEVREQLPKWMGTFPYPYMNGSLHLGHAFTISKIEFNAGYQRMLGKRALFPMAFHCTGMPIKAAADKLVREIEMFGPDFERYSPDEEPPKSEPAPVVAAPATAVDKAKKGKVAAKATGLQYQFQIMESIGVPRVEIKQFANPLHWLKYFPPIARADCTAFGARIDWRRSFITTDVNPYYDSFVRWQMNKLHAMNKIKFGERYTIYSPKDGQPCMDHDRQDGEGVGPQEYTGIKMQVKEWSDAAAKALPDNITSKKVYLVAATLRPETMYGQTNCFVGKEITYGLYAVKDDAIFLCTHRAIRNMAFQGVTPSRGEIKELAQIPGAALIGTKVHAPLSVNPEVWVLPMEGVLANKGTGVVTSVPSDSPADAQTLLDLRKKPEFYGIDPSWAAFDPVPIISTPTYGDLTAPALLKALKIQSQKDTKQLTEAKDIAYKEAFYGGTMLVGPCKGMSVQDAKPKVRDELIAGGEAFAYSEPEGWVMSRSGDECVVSLEDQWYLDYGEKEWRAQAESLLSKMNTYNQETRNAFEAILAWLNQWACARSFGLGSRLPWDPTFLVESLSDSTIYMSYYTVAHLLQGGVVDGSKTGPLGITPDQLTDEVWDFILSSPSPNRPPPKSTIPNEHLLMLQREFAYFYPMDIRSSGKDLIGNHLTFAIYNHAALFEEKLWPLSMRANGHLMLNGKKMSKSTGNSLTLRDSLEKFGADATRLALADAGDGIEDANFEEKTANAAIMRLYTLIEWCEDVMGKVRGEIPDGKDVKMRTGGREAYSFHDKVFEQEVTDLIAKTKASYEATNYKDALKDGFYELQSARDWYREVTVDMGMHANLAELFIRTSALLVLPVAPHFSEHVWRHILREPTTVQNARWPAPPAELDQSILGAATYMRGIVKTIRDADLALQKRSGKKGGAAGTALRPNDPKSVRIFVARRFPDWQDACVGVVEELWKQGAAGDEAKLRKTLGDKGLLKDKKVMPFVQAFKKRVEQFGPETAFNRTLPFDEAQVLRELEQYMKRNMDYVSVDVAFADESAGKTGPGYSQVALDVAEPGAPGFVFWNP
ncbi:Isoleucyl-tRNA synthetase [Ceratobasidium sp. AG-Ba]|nr:Isoleucyl-tRNA synthetase [Ceratobasidium sp. AG-Ba]